jgi:hypothetical protein
MMTSRIRTKMNLTILHSKTRHVFNFKPLQWVFMEKFNGQTDTQGLTTGTSTDNLWNPPVFQGIPFYLSKSNWISACIHVYHMTDSLIFHCSFICELQHYIQSSYIHITCLSIMQFELLNDHAWDNGI